MGDIKQVIVVRTDLNMGKGKIAAQFNECKEDDFKADACIKYRDRINNEASGIFVDPSVWK